MRLRCASIILCLLAFQLSTAIAHAQNTGTTATWRGIWNGTNLTVFVVTRGHGISTAAKQSQPWWRWGNTTTDAYLFSWSKDNSVDLILDFSLEEEHPKATLYAPFTSAQRSGIRIGEGAYALPEGLWPSLTLWPRDGDWLIQGQPSFNLEGRQIDPSSGIPEWKISVGGEMPGLPKWEVNTLLNDPHPEDGYSRFIARVREDMNVPYELAMPLMPSWPYLSAIVKEPHYGKNQPIFFDLETHRIVSEDVWAGFHTAGLYEINSLSYPPQTDFEAPFAFYRFDPQAGRYPNLVIRSDVWPASSSFGPPIPDTQRTVVKMSWTEKTPGLWRYSLSCIGNYQMDEQVVVGDAVIRGESYWKFPSWIASKPWKAMTFVEATQGEPGSEGIYDYSVEDNYPVSFWVNGRSEKRPDTFHAPFLSYPNIDPNRLKLGFRGEYSLYYNRIPQLYFSPFDNRVHLLYAEEGVWNLGNGLVLRMHNLDAGPYINGWTRERVPGTTTQDSAKSLRAWPGHVEEALYALRGFLIYSGAQGAELRRAEYQLSDFDLRPPTDKGSWQLFNDQLAPFTAQQRNPNNLRSWLSYFPGQTLSMANGQISDVRTLANGFRFVLELKPGFHVQEDDLFDVNALEAGRYVVTYNGQLNIKPLTSPVLSVTLSPAKLIQLEPGTIQVSLRNDGLEDVPAATLELWATSPNGITKVVATQNVQLLAQEPVILNLAWAPSSSGAWVLTPKIRQADGHLISGNPTSVEVAPSENKNPLRLLLVSAPLSRLPILVIGLILLAMPTALVFWHEWAKPLMRKENDQAQSLDLKEKKNKELTCPNCQTREKQRKAGFNRSGSQRYRCGDCRRVYTPNPKPHGYSVETRMLAISMYQGGNSYKAIGRVLKVSPQSVANWTKQYASQLSVPTNFSTPEVAVSYRFLVEKNESYLRELE